MSSIIDSLKRLERAGSENSRTTQKLRESAFEVAHFITEKVPFDAVLPRGYETEDVSVGESGSKRTFTYLKSPVLWSDGYREEVQYIVNGYWVRGADRAAILQLAADIADGLLDEIAAWLEQRSQQNESSTDVLVSLHREHPLIAPGAG